MAYSAIDIGQDAANYDGECDISYTRFNLGNPANATGVLTNFEIWMNTAGTGVKVGTFSGSGTTYGCRDYELLGSVTNGSKQTFTGKNCTVNSGDFIGAYGTGNLERNNTGGSGTYYRGSDHTEDGQTAGWTNEANFKLALYATGHTVPDPPTNVAASENDGAKVTITWTKSSGATGYRVYRDGADISGLLGDVATYDDTTAEEPVITAGAATASDGAYADKVSFSLSGNSIANGTEYTYTVKAVNVAGISGASSGDTGYRKAQTVSLQWQKSNGDASFASFSDIAGATSVSGDDTDIAAEGLASGYALRYYKVKISSAGLDDAYSTVSTGCRDAGGRYYRCKLSATGSTTVYSTANRGYRATAATSFIQEIMRVHYVPSLGGF